MAQGLESLLTGHTLVKRYQIEEVIGRGGFAVVYRAMDTRLSRPVAVKVITLTATDPEHRETLRQRLHKEAQAAASLPHHPNLVTVHDVGTDPELGLDFLVMEMLRGENLSQSLSRDGKPPLDRALCILRDTAQGLAVGHRAGLIHRDVKPGNIFLAEGIEGNAEDVRVCLLDYGIAQASEDDQTVTRGVGNNAMSPAFASPEQVRGDRNVTAATDVFSLGVVGYQLLTGERPFASEPGQLPTGWAVRQPIRALNPQVPAQGEAVVMKAMSVDAGDRYADADHFVQALAAATHQPLQDRVHAALSHVAVPPPVIDAEEDDGTIIAPARSIHAVPPPDDEGTIIAPAHPRPAAHVSTRARTVPSAAASRPRRRWPVVLVVALLLVAAAAWAALSGGDRREDPNVNAVLPDDEPGEAPSTEDGAVAAPPPAPDAPMTRDGFGIGGDGSESADGGVPAFEGQQPAQRPSTPNQQPQPSGGQPQRPPAAQQPPVSQPQPQRPPAQQPPEQQPPVQQEPPPQQTRPEPRLLGRPVEPAPAPPPPVTPNPNAPRDTIRISNPPR
jgi:serine/threonine protein kinase